MSGVQARLSAGGTSRLPAGGDKIRHTWDRLRAFGLEDLRVRPEDQWEGQPTEAELALARSLRRSIETRIETANDHGTLATAVTWLEHYAAAFPHRRLFMPRGGAGDAAAASYNAGTLSELREYIRLHGSIGRGSNKGRTLSGDTIDSYVDALSAAVGACSEAQLVSSTFNTRQPKQAKHMRLEKVGLGAPSSRAKSLGFRSCHLRMVAASTFDRLTLTGKFKWLMAVMIHDGLMRPGEPGAGGKGKAFQPAKGLTFANVRWWGADVTSLGRPAVVLMLMPIKDQHGRNVRHPVPFMARGAAEDPDDPMCIYSLLMGYWRQHVGTVCRRFPHCTGDDVADFCTSCQLTPLFRWPHDGRVWRSPDTLALYREMAPLAGIDPAGIEGRAGRIGGASDTRQICERQFGPTAGCEHGMRLLEQRGRWHTDIAWIYARAGPEAQMVLSAVIEAVMADATGGDMEHLIKGWTQPA